MSDWIASTAPLRTAAGWTMLHMLWIGAGWGMASAATRRLLRSARPETRYAVALAALLGLALSPPLLFVQTLERAPRTAVTPAPPALAATPARAAGHDLEAIDRPARLALPSARSDAPAAPSLLDGTIAALAWLWAGGSALTLALVGTGLVGVERLRRSSLPLGDGAIAAHCRQLADSLGIARRVGVGICDRIAGPVLVGIVRPMILLPPAALCGWSVEQLEMVLLHELAHLRRWDNLVNLVQRLVESLLFFHPAAWWLSGWVRLERELCCDRLVVARTGRPSAYAELLASLAGLGRAPRRRTALAMADGEVLTRVRRILNVENEEDRSMRVTMPEGVGLVLSTAAVGLVLTLALGVRAAAPPEEKPNADRQALRQAVDTVTAWRNDAPTHEAMRATALAAIAEAQLALGDRESARSTLRRAYEALGRTQVKRVTLDVIECDWLGGLSEVARLQREAGDGGGAEATLRRMASLAAELPAEPAESKITPSKDGGLDRVDQFSGNLIRAELCGTIAEEWLAQGNRGEALTLVRRALPAARAEKGPLGPLMLGTFGAMLFRCGDPVGARAVINEARHAAEAQTEPRYRQKSLAYVAQALAQVDDLDGALALASSFPDEPGRRQALQLIIQNFTREAHPAYFKPAGLKITIGASGFAIKDTAAARRSLPKIADAARACLGTLGQARVLSQIAHLQAKAGNLAAAIDTAESIPALRRADFAGPSDGFYDAIRPATLALVAAEQMKAGDAAPARAGLDRALALGRAVTTASEKVIALLVIARAEVESGKKPEARTLLAETVALARALPEPRRSRCLVELSAAQIDAGDIPGAEQTAAAVRSTPGLEKLHALDTLAEAHEKAGDHQAAQSYLRQSVACADRLAAAKPASTSAQGPYLPNSYTAHSFQDPDLELNPIGAGWHAGNPAITLRARLGDRDGAVRAARALPAAKRDGALQAIVRQLADQGDMTGALDLASTLNSAEGRMIAVVQAATAFSDRPTRR